MDAEGVAEAVLDLGAGEVGIAVGIEEYGFGGEELAEAVDFDGSSFEDHAAFEALEAEGGRDEARDVIIEVEGWEFAAPGVEIPVGDGDFAGFLVFEEDGAVVAAPDIVVGVVEEFDAFRDGAVLEAEGADGVVGGGGCVDADGFEVGDGGGDFREFLVDEIAFGTAPVAWVIDGPGEPDGGLGGPFRGHGEAEGSGIHGWEHGEGSER